MNIAIIGAGLMGTGLALDFSTGGHTVRLFDSSEDARRSSQNAIKAISSELARVAGDRFRAASKTVTNIVYSPAIADTVAGADFVIEAVPENLSTKRQVLAGLEEHLPHDVVIASNTSSLLPAHLSEGMQNPERFIVAHFFNPPYLIPAVEIISGPQTLPAVVSETRRILSDLGKYPVVLRKPVPGFIVNRLQCALLREALHLVDEGVADPAEIDGLVSHSFGRRLAAAGIFEVFDLAGWDVIGSMSRFIFPDLCSEGRIPMSLEQRLERGELGIKTGKGFYDWNDRSPDALKRRVRNALIVIEQQASESINGGGMIKRSP